MAIPETFAFKKGWSQVQKSRIPIVRDAIIEAIGKNSPQGFYSRLNGLVEPKASEFLKIEEIFHKEGIYDIWGE